MRPVRFAILGPTPPFAGGIVAHTAALAEALAAHGAEVLVLGYSRIYPGLGLALHGQRAPRPTPVRASHDEPGSALDTLSPASWGAVARAVDDFAADALLVQWWHPVTAPALAAAAAARAAPTLAICPNAHPPEPFPAAASLARRFLGACDGLLCHSRFVHAQAGDLAPRVPRALAPLPPLLAPGLRLRDRDEARQVLGLAARDRLALAAGLRRPYKDDRRLVAAWARLAAAGLALAVVGPSYQGPLAGRGPLRRSLPPGVIERNQYVSDQEFIDWIMAADVLVAAYGRASQSAVVTLARALGRATVVSAAGGLAETEPGDDPSAAGGRAAPLYVAGAGVAGLAATLAEALGQAATPAQPAPAVAAVAAAAWGRVIEEIQGLLRRMGTSAPASTGEAC